MTSIAKTGDKVETKWGAGIVGRVRISRRGSAEMRAWADYLGGSCMLDVEVVDIVVVQDDRAGIVSMPAISAKVIEAGAVPAAAARDMLQGMQNKIKSRKYAAQADRWDESREAGLTRLAIGTTVEVQLKGSAGSLVWCRAQFKGFVAGSGNVRLDYNGRKITCSPKFVRPLQD